ncbi:MAG: N-acetylmuramoyl-L-alanine amidase, partial [Rhodobacteraceae bacterium]|nr:N-acetylmuramoyl-L-alanine amidase [Paracoccaceae bacterium]
LGVSARVKSLSWGPFLEGWSRMVAVLDAPLALQTAEETRSKAGGATIRLRFLPTSSAAFAKQIAAQNDSMKDTGWALPAAAKVDAPIRRQTGDRPLRVVLDPGHGGLDPGAGADKETEAGLMLTFALELADVLSRTGIEVTLTRRTDIFVPLETRISLARAARADLFLSLHADAVPEGEAEGATIYRLDEKASDRASEKLAERHDRADLLAGIDLSGNDDEVAGVLMDLARTETRSRTELLAARLAAAIKAAGLKTHRHPIQGAAFSVLKSADIPSILLETGFLSSDKDRARLLDREWRARLQQAIRTALQGWAVEDAAQARLIRQ